MTSQPELTRIGLLNAQSIGKNAKSVANKSADICERIVSDRLHICAVVETWHDSIDCPNLIACTPPGYTYVEKARTRSDSASQSVRTNHGGLCLFYASSISARQVQLPVCKSRLEVLGVMLHSARRSAFVVVLYHPEKATDAFFDDLDNVLERTSTFGCPVIVMGDINLHLDVISDAHTIRFQSLLDSYGLIQNVTSPTHTHGHLLDVIVTRSDCPASVCVELPTLSDHSFITADVDLQFSHCQPATVVRRRMWRRFDYDKFCDDMKTSTLLTNPPSDADGLFACYDDTLRTLVDKHAPFADVKLRAHRNAPWYDDDCRAVKAETRRLERIFRSNRSDAVRKAWRHQSRYQRFSSMRDTSATGLMP